MQNKNTNGGKIVPNTEATFKISSQFDSGNIRCLTGEGPGNIRLEINKDNGSDFYQWFYYRLSGVKNQTCVMTIENAKGAAFEDAWDGYNACASYDGNDWFRVPTEYENGELIISHTPEHDSVFYAFFAPYTMQRHLEFIGRLQMHPAVNLSILGQTLDGQDMDLLTIGEPGKDKKNIWVIARQHPGESMAEWWMEGFLERLLNSDDPVARELREKCVFYVVPNMNPDGSKRGHLRTNACGANLNREWTVATMERSPEVLLVMKHMDKTGVDFCLDVHGDEALPYNFIAAADGVDKFDDVHAKRLVKFLQAYKDATPEFQTKHGYAVDAPGTADLTMCTNYVAQAHNCLAMTLEMPFKDNADLPDAHAGWSTKRCAKLGEDVLDAMLAVWNDL
ncbi:MAG: hypothetical protein JKY94_00425 [Rhodobacteraceae bacterium]|nr:hypothetical protein [Paracoccaceae bacterium]